MQPEIEVVFSTATADGKEGRLGIDKEGRVYWNEKELVTKQKISLQWWVNVSVLIGALSTLTLAAVAVIQLFRDVT